MLSVAQCGSRQLSQRGKNAEAAERPEFAGLRRQGNILFRSGQYLNAIDIYEKGYRAAKGEGNLRSAVRFLNNIGSANYAIYRYREAIQAYLTARNLAGPLGDPEMLCALNSNLSSLYFDSRDLESSLECAGQALKLPAAASAKFKAKLLLQCARIRREQNDESQAAALLEQAVEAARAVVDASSESQAWNDLGSILLDGAQFAPAEHALLEAFRLRILTGDDRLYFTYELLGILRVHQGDFKSAVTLLDRAVDSARAAGAPAVSDAYYFRGKGKLAQGQHREAFEDFGAALKFARLARKEILPADVFRIGTDVALQDLYSSFIEAGSMLYADTGQSRFAELAFSAAEDGRAASLRALWLGPDLTTRLPARYWETLAKYEAAQSAAIKGEAQPDPGVVSQLHLRMTEMETHANLDFPADQDPLDSAMPMLIDRTRRKLRVGEAFFSFRLGETESFLWVLTSEALEFRRLPARKEIGAAVSEFVKSVRENSPEAVIKGNQLYSQLFGGVSPRSLSRPVWTVAPDGPLFELPFGALVEQSKSPSEQTYVIERHVIRLVPGVWALLDKTGSVKKGFAVGLGDPIYNLADQRLLRRLDSRQSRPVASPRLQLARLAGSGREIEQSARIWRSQGYEPILLLGAQANKVNLANALRRNPSVVHIAAHMLIPRQNLTPGNLALTFDAYGELELLSASEIANMRMQVGLVVMNGCSSAQAEALPGAGLMGMTRAWLAAGARAVIATRWAVGDQESEEFVGSLYDHISDVKSEGNHVSFSQLLQQAQLRALRSGRRPNPSRWAAYFCVERN